MAVQEVPAEGRLRKVFTLSDAGRDALREKLCELLAEPEHLKWRVDLATYNVERLAPDRAAECLAGYRAKLEEQVVSYRELEKFLIESGCPRRRLAVARRPAFLLEGEIRWVDEFISELRGDTAIPALESPA